MINIEYLKLSKKNINIVKELILKDSKNECFFNRDGENNFISIDEMAYIFLDCSDLYGINYDNKIIGILSVSNDNEIGIFIDPEYQHKGIGKKALLDFIEILKEDYVAQELVTQIVNTNEISINLFTNIGFIEAKENNNTSNIKKYTLNVC